MCFNAAKSWDIGWYTDRQIEIDTELHFQSWTGRLAPIADYRKLNDDGINYHVLAKVGNLYLSYNKQKGINADTQNHKDRVTVVESMGGLSSKSNVVASLSIEGHSKRYSHISLGVTIEVCDVGIEGRVDFAIVSIFPYDTQSTCKTVSNGSATQLTSSLKEMDSNTKTPKKSLDHNPIESVLTHCGKHEFELTLVLKTDEYPKETSWELFNAAKTDVEYSPIYTEAKKEHVFTTCANSEVEYRFALLDSGWNGLGGSGFYALFVDGQKIHVGGRFTHREVVHVHAPCPSTMMRAVFNIKTDEKAAETSIQLKADGHTFPTLDTTEGPFSKLEHHIISKCIPSGCYTLTVKDSGGNGMCCDFGQGSYSISLDDMLLVKSVFPDGSSETHRFGDLCEVVDTDCAPVGNNTQHQRDSHLSVAQVECGCESILTESRAHHMLVGECCANILRGNSNNRRHRDLQRICCEDTSRGSDFNQVCHEALSNERRSNWQEPIHSDSFSDYHTKSYEPDPEPSPSSGSLFWALFGFLLLIAIGTLLVSFSQQLSAKMGRAKMLMAIRRTLK